MQGKAGADGRGFALMNFLVTLLATKFIFV